jgi:hypothetical protein
MGRKMFRGKFRFSFAFSYIGYLGAIDEPCKRFLSALVFIYIIELLVILSALNLRWADFLCSGETREVWGKVFSRDLQLRLRSLTHSAGFGACARLQRNLLVVLLPADHHGQNASFLFFLGCALRFARAWRIPGHQIRQGRVI